MQLMINLTYGALKRWLDKENHIKIFIYCIGFETFEVVKPLYIIFNKINGYIEDNNDN